MQKVYYIHCCLFHVTYLPHEFQKKSVDRVYRQTCLKDSLKSGVTCCKWSV